MELAYGTPEDIKAWMGLVSRISGNFPGLETREKLDEHAETVLRFMQKRQAICVKEDGGIVGVMLFSRNRNMICCLGVSPDSRRRGVASMLMEDALRNLDRTKEISVCTFRAEDAKGPAPRALYEKYGFLADELVEELGYPNQKYVLHPAGSERFERQKAVNRMTRAIAGILAKNSPSVYLYGSSVLGDFRLGWSDIDLLVLTEKRISDAQAQKLVCLRQRMLETEPGNPYYRLFEGGMLTLDAFLSKAPDRVVYWGTSGERITDAYGFNSFDRAELMAYGALLHGRDVRANLKMPGYDEMYADAKRHCETIRQHVQKTGRSFYSFGWLLDIARCLYTLRTGKIVGKMAAGEWALENGLCPVPDALSYAVRVRKAPLKYRYDEQTLAYAETLAGPIQRFADVLEAELENNRQNT